MKKEQTIAMLMSVIRKISITEIVLLILEVVFIVLSVLLSNSTAQLVFRILCVVNITIAGILAIISGYIDSKITTIEESGEE